jgi:hypothetical protein
MALYEKIAASTVMKHLVIISHDSNARQAFCNKCGRHYRYHDINTGACPVTPFDADGDDK